MIFQLIGFLGLPADSVWWHPVSFDAYIEGATRRREYEYQLSARLHQLSGVVGNSAYGSYDRKNLIKELSTHPDGQRQEAEGSGEVASAIEQIKTLDKALGRETDKKLLDYSHG